nr:hypothetical protein JVH1_1949 [Rhodococcus sp. JVH1]
MDVLAPPSSSTDAIYSPVTSREICEGHHAIFLRCTAVTPRRLVNVRKSS